MFDLKKLSDFLAGFLSKELVKSKDETEVISYGIFAFFQITLGIIATLIFGIIFNVAKEALIVTLSIIILRKSSGGVHASTPWKCISITVLLGLGFSVLSKTIVCDIFTLLMINFIIFIISFILILIYAPCDSLNKPIKSITKRKRLKKLSIITVIVLFSISLSLIFFRNIIGFKYTSYSLSVSFGVLWQSFTLTPFAKKVLHNII